MVKKKISMTIDHDIYDDFKRYCNENGMKVSTKVELLMKDTVVTPTLKKFMK